MVHKAALCWMLAIGMLCFPSPGDAQDASVVGLQWLAGCWERRAGDLLVEEQWLEPRAGLVLGMSRTTRGDSLVGYEFMRISSRGDTLSFLAQPSNQPAAVFTTTTQTARGVVFENPAHDFPQRVHYRAVGSDSLLAAIEGTVGGELQRVEFPYARGRCPPTPD